MHGAARAAMRHRSLRCAPDPPSQIFTHSEATVFRKLSRLSAIPLRIRHFFNATISRKICAIFLVILLVAATNVRVVQAMLGDLNGVAETVNVAGKLRMLSQKIAFEATKALHDPTRPTDAGINSIRDFDIALNALMQGGEAFGLRVKTPSPQLHLPFQNIQRHWSTYRLQVLAVLASPPPAIQSGTELARITESAALLLADAESIVETWTQESQQAQAAALLKMYALLLLDVVVFALVFATARRTIVQPLRTLAKQTGELAAGNYAARSRFSSQDEIGQLSEVLNHSAQRIGELVADIDKERHSLRQTEAMFRGLAENSVVGAYIVQNRKFRFVNPKMAEMFGFSQAEMVTSIDVFDIATPAARELLDDYIGRHMHGEPGEVKYECQVRRKDGSLFEAEVFGSSMEIDGRPATIGILLDITRRKQAETAHRLHTQELEYHAHHDPLTGLANRNLLSDRLRQAIASANRHERMVAVLLHDMDNFKVINDSMGHAAGDALLQAVAARMSSAVRETDTVARLGGDEFVIVMPDVNRAEDAAAVARKVLDVLTQPFAIANRQIYLSASIGISLYPQDGRDEGTLFNNVDLAMYRAKRPGRSNLCFYADDLPLDGLSTLADAAPELDHWLGPGPVPIPLPASDRAA